MTKPLRHRDVRPLDTRVQNSSAVAPMSAAGKMRAFVNEHRAATVAGVSAVAFIAGVAALLFFGDDAPPTKKIQEFTIVAITPPPPPPPPPPPEQKPPEPEMIEQQPIVDPQIKEEAKVEEPKEAPPDSNDSPPPGPLGPGSDLPVGPGQSNFAPGGGGGGGGGGSRWGYYSAMVQREIEAALRANPKTRNSVGQIQVRLWADSTGRVTRVQIVSFTGEAEVDTIIRGEVLPGLALRQPPPTDMPMPMIARITMRRSG